MDLGQDFTYYLTSFLILTEVSGQRFGSLGIQLCAHSDLVSNMPQKLICHPFPQFIIT